MADVVRLFNKIIVYLSTKLYLPHKTSNPKPKPKPNFKSKSITISLNLILKFN